MTCSNTVSSSLNYSKSALYIHRTKGHSQLLFRVYAILIEYCCETNYNVVTLKVSRDFQTKIALLNKQIEVAKDSYIEKKYTMTEEREYWKTEYDSMNKKTKQYTKHISKLNEYITYLRDRNDEEIKIRK